MGQKVIIRFWWESGLSRLDPEQWRAEVWWCPGRILDWMPPTKFYSIEQWHMVVILTGYTLFVTSYRFSHGITTGHVS